MKNRRLSNDLQRVKATLERFRLPLLILTLGGILLLLPSGGTGKAPQDAQPPAQRRNRLRICGRRSRGCFLRWKASDGWSCC